MAEGFVQVIDYGGAFVEAVSNYIETSGVQGGYHTVAILGPQSSGKSTLLNQLFETKFPVLQPIKGRVQTTKGVYLAKAQEADLFAFDIEGSDSKERSESAEGLEGKLALFALTVADVVILNTWFHDVGRYEASNYTILNTVFEANLKLFHGEGSLPATKTQLLVVIRDFDEDANLVVLQQTIVSEVEKIWQEIGKPPQFETAQLDDFFELSFVPLPHYRHKREAFEQEVSALRGRFTNATESGYLFSTASSVVPVAKLAAHLKETWDLIKTNKETDIPNDRELAALYRCDEVAQAKLQEASRQVARWKAQVQNGDVVDQFASKSKELLDDVLAAYGAGTEAYAGTVSREKKEEELRRLVLTDLHAVFSQQIIILRDETFNRIKNTVSQAMPIAGPRSVVTDNDLKNLMDSADKYLDKQCQDSKLKDSDWTYEAERAELKSMMQEFIAERKRTIKSMPGPGGRKAGYFLSPNVDFNVSFSLLTAINLGPRQNVGLPLGEEMPETLAAPNSVYSAPDGEPGIDLDKIDMSGDPLKTRLTPFR